MADQKESIKECQKVLKEAELLEDRINQLCSHFSVTVTRVTVKLTVTMQSINSIFTLVSRLLE